MTNILLSQNVFWRKWAAKHECDELKGVLTGSDPGYVAEKSNEEWTDKHRSVMRKLVVEGG